MKQVTNLFGTCCANDLQHQNKYVETLHFNYVFTTVLKIMFTHKIHIYRYRYTNRCLHLIKNIQFYHHKDTKLLGWLMLKVTSGLPVICT